MTDTKVCQRYSEILRTGELLSSVYRRICNGGKAITQFSKKNKKWEWTEKEEKVFKELKDRFTKEPVLAAPDIN